MFLPGRPASADRLSELLGATRIVVADAGVGQRTEEVVVGERVGVCRVATVTAVATPTKVTVRFRFALFTGTTLVHKQSHRHTVR